MAEVSGTFVLSDDGVAIMTWSAMAGGDTGKPARMGRYSDKTVHVVGDSVDVAMEGSNDLVNWAPVHNAVGAAMDTIVGTPPGTIETILDNPLYIRPNVTGGSSTSVIVVAKVTGK